MAKKTGPSKKDQLVAELARGVGAGREVAVETVDFSDPNRPKTCLEVDFPILPVNQVAVIEGNAGKPIYQMSKWWARRRSSVFRALLLAAAMKAPENPAEAARNVWDVYYANHQAKGALAHLKVADIFAGGGTTLVEGSRLGMQMIGSELNPVAWFVIRNEFAKVEPDEVEALLRDVEAEVKPRIMPYYACDCPRGHKGKWTDKRDGRVMGPEFKAWEVAWGQRHHYEYDGPEIIYVFWCKHGPCMTTDCGHLTPLMSAPVMAVKSLTVKAWSVTCPSCSSGFELEDGDARMAPGVPLFVAPAEPAFAVLEGAGHVSCPHCKVLFLPAGLGKGTNKKVELSLLVHSEWLAGCPATLTDGTVLGGSATDTPEATEAWLRERARTLRLLEVRGALPEEVRCPETGVVFSSSVGTIPKRATFACSSCGSAQAVLDAIKSSARSGPMAPYAIHGYCPVCNQDGKPYRGRFFGIPQVSALCGALYEWEERKNLDLADLWPRSELPYGFMTHVLQGGLPNHGFTHWWTMFNPTQLLVLTQLLGKIKAYTSLGKQELSETLLGAFQQYLRNQNLFCFWNLQGDKLEPHFSNNNYHPKSNVVENCVFPLLGRGNWSSCSEGIIEGLAWSRNPWELLCVGETSQNGSAKAVQSEKVHCFDPITGSPVLFCASSSDLPLVPDASLDIVVTDPPFEGLLHYSELSDFFYVWLRLALKEHCPAEFGPEHTPKILEAVANRARHGDDASNYYRRILTECWREAHRTLKPGGILAFTFHHSEDEPWVHVLESLFEAGFYLEATYPIRADETKGEGSKPGTFGSQKIEYDIIHVCRKRLDEPSPVSWARMRKAVLEDIDRLRNLLESHAKAGLPGADLQVIRRGKALEYYSRHYGQVYIDEDTKVDVRRAVLGVNQLLDESASPLQDPPPAACDPITRQFLRIFAESAELPRDQMQKYMRGTGIAPSDFEERGWCHESHKIYQFTDPLTFAQNWRGRQRQKLAGDLDQALVLVGACFENSGIRTQDTLDNPNFKAHPALQPLLEWMTRRKGWPGVPSAAKTALTLLRRWLEGRQAPKTAQLDLFSEV